jgi:hypothetical protein
MNNDEREMRKLAVKLANKGIRIKETTASPWTKSMYLTQNYELRTNADYYDIGHELMRLNHKILDSPLYRAINSPSEAQNTPYHLRYLKKKV